MDRSSSNASCGGFLSSRDRNSLATTRNVQRRRRLATRNEPTSPHGPRHKAARFRMTIKIVRPNHRAASAVRSLHDSFVRNINPLAIDTHAIVTIPAFPIGIVNALRIAAIAAWPLATVQALIPTVQFRALMIVSASDCNDRQYESESSEYRTPKSHIHFAPNPWVDHIRCQDSVGLSARLGETASLGLLS
jgi:hypothetical protein